MRPTIVTAKACDVYLVSAIEAIEQDDGVHSEALAVLYKGMKTRGGVRYLVKPTDMDSFADLRAACPNFSEVVTDLQGSAALALAGNEAIEFMPILLLGEAGIGKTYFSKMLAKTIGTYCEFIPMNSLTAGWVLSGASSQWNNAKPGRIAQALINGEYANPIAVLDEIDKAGGDSRYDPLGALYGLLERDTAQKFKDEFVEVDMDASHVLWISTANDERAIPDPILNRMNVYAIPRPDQEAMRGIAIRLYVEITAGHDWGFSEKMSDEVLESISAMPARDMRKALLKAFGSAKIDNRDHLIAKDLDIGRNSQNRRIGF